MRPVLFLLLTGIAIASCNTNPKEAAPIRHLNGYIRFLTDEGNIHAELDFLERKDSSAQPTSIQLPKPPIFKDERMSINVVKGKNTYVLDESAAYHPFNVFTWEDAQNKPFELSIPMPAVTAFNFDPKPIRLGQPAVFKWTGGPFAKGESFVYIWEKTDTRETVPMEIVGAPNASQIEFPAAQLSKLKPGTWKLYIVRKRLQRGSVQDMSYEFITEFYSRTLEFEVSP